MVHALLLFILSFLLRRCSTKCVDRDSSCREWSLAGFCKPETYVMANCDLSCGQCDPDAGTPKKYDISQIPPDLWPVRRFIGIWQSDFDGKAHFPTMPIFTYGERLDFSIAEPPVFGARSLNYSAVAQSINNGQELHSEYGFLSVQNHTSFCALIVVMNSGFTTVEEGYVSENQLVLNAKQIGRISFSRDLPVKESRRTFTFLDDNTLEQKFEMGTLTHPLQQHTIVRYRRIFP